MKKIILVIILVLVALGAYGYYLRPAWLAFIPWFKPRVLTTEEISAKQQACLKRLPEAQKITEAIKANKQMVTEPKIFFSPAINSCVMGYLVQDLELPENTTFNSFRIYDLDHKKRLYEKGEGAITNFVSYLDKIKALGGK